MSTPLSKRNNLDGLALYAPRRAREQAAYAPPADPPQPEDESAGDHIPIAAEPDGEVDPETAQQRIEEAIRKIVALGHSDEPPMSAPTKSSPSEPSPALTPRSSQEEHVHPRVRFAARNDDENSPSIRSPRRRSRLDAEIVPEPPVAERRNIFPLLIRLGAAMMIAAVVAYGMTKFASMHAGAPPDQRADNQVAEAAPDVQQPRPEPQSEPPRLIVEDQQAFANEPLPLILMVQHPQQNASLLFDGLAQGTRLSAGAAVSPSSWQVPYDQAQGLSLQAPKNFTGVMNAAVSLIGSDQQLLDTQAVQFRWIARQAKPVADAAPAAAAPTAAAPVPAPAPAAAQPPAPAPAPKPVVVATAGDPSASGAIKSPAAKSVVDPAEAAMLMQRGSAFLGAGDIAAARVAFSRLADAGVADALVALANTYDPTYLAAHHVMGVQGDRGKARDLYQRAKDLGSNEAAQILARMTGK
jgi:hypothetical protein